MNIIIDNLVFEWQKAGGISVVWHELIKRMINDSTIRQHVSFVEYPHTNDNLFHKELGIKQEAVIKKCSATGFTWKRYLNLSLHADKKFIFHSTYYRVCSNSNAINIVTVHDFTYEYFNKGLKKYIHSLIKNRAIRSADYIVCISENTKKDLIKFVPDVNKDKIYVIPNGCSDDFFVISQDRLDYYENFLLFVGSRATYKNFDLAVQVAKQSNLKLKIVGSILSNSEKAFVEEHLSNKYEELGRIDNHRLNEEYNKALALIYPSSYEGFGLPVIEAQRAGCPVVAILNSSIKEIFGDCSYLSSDNNVSSLCDIVSHLKDVPGYRDNIVSLGLQNASKYTWDKTYNLYKNLYLHIIQDENIGNHSDME